MNIICPSCKGWPNQPCEDCDGTGKQVICEDCNYSEEEELEKTTNTPCYYCLGTGLIPWQEEYTDPSRACATCNGAGETLCSSCKGKGVVPDTIPVTI